VPPRSHGDSTELGLRPPSDATIIYCFCYFSLAFMLIEYILFATILFGEICLATIIFFINP
jgi:hypothetical protein